MMDPAGLAIWFLLSALVGWVVVDLYVWAKRPRVTPIKPGEPISIVRRGGVYYGGPTPEGDPPIPRGWTKPSAVLSTDEPLTLEARRALMEAWYAHGGRPSTVVQTKTWGGDVVRWDPL